MIGKPLTDVAIDTFTGQVSAADPRDIPATAAQTVLNLQSEQVGALTIRGGLKEVVYDVLN